MRQRLPGRTAGRLLHRELWMHGLQFVLYEGSVNNPCRRRPGQTRNFCHASDRDAEHGDPT